LAARLAAGERPATRPQPGGAGSSHTRADFEALRDGGGHGLSPAERERLARCLTFPGVAPPAALTAGAAP
jgi:hypothetical protein